MGNYFVTAARLKYYSKMKKVVNLFTSEKGNDYIIGNSKINITPMTALLTVFPGNRTLAIMLKSSEHLRDFLFSP